MGDEEELETDLIEPSLLGAHSVLLLGCFHHTTNRLLQVFRVSPPPLSCIPPRRQVFLPYYPVNEMPCSPRKPASEPRPLHTPPDATFHLRWLAKKLLCSLISPNMSAYTGSSIATFVLDNGICSEGASSAAMSCMMRRCDSNMASAAPGGTGIK